MFNLFFSFQGKINRRQFWIGTIVIVAISSAIDHFASLHFNGVSSFDLDVTEDMLADTSYRMIFGIAGTLLLVPDMAILIKRANDRARRHMWVYLYAMASLIYYFLYASKLLFIGDETQFNIEIFIFVVLAIFGVWILIDLGFMKGKPSEDEN